MLKIDSAMDLIGDTVKKTGYMLYILNPSDQYYEKIEDVPDYFREVIPIIVIIVLLEQAILLLQGKPMFRLNDFVCNSCLGVLSLLAKIPLKGTEVWMYCWVYNNYRLMTLPWNSPYTWFFCWLFTDFCYYWMHRAFHHVNILWAIHEVHHTPEDMTFTAPIRNHILLLPFHWLTYLPMAFAIPPTVYLVHYQIGIIFQVWLHTEIFGKMPAVIEYFFTTPNHHKVHHGCNRKYIDKNYGGFLIIWDRMFGTYAEECEKPTYGTTSQLRSFNPLIIQTRHFVAIWKKFWEVEGIGNKFSALFKGPGWAPGKPWSGRIEDIPEPGPDFKKYDPILPLWAKVYVILHFGLFAATYILFAFAVPFLSRKAIFVIASYLAYGTCAFGFILDLSPYALPAEFLRFLLYFAADFTVFPEVTLYGIIPTLFISLNRFFFVQCITMCTMKLFYDSFNELYKEKFI